VQFGNGVHMELILVKNMVWKHEILSMGVVVLCPHDQGLAG
jgi:hypothetical protein